MNVSGTVTGIYRYPVKGLSPEPLARAELSVGRPIAFDRAYAIENGPSGFDPAIPTYLPKMRFLMLMRNARLAGLRTIFDAATQTLTIRYEGRDVARGDLRTRKGCAAVERFLSEHCADEFRGPPKVLASPGHSFSDMANKVVSIVNLASISALENAIGAPVNPLRMRGNLYISGWPAWHEFELIGRTLTLGNSVRLKIRKRIQRCAATNVDPDTGIRDLSIPRTLSDTFGHDDCGVYAEVIRGGEVAEGDHVSELAPKLPL
jgi:uncharacterized protein YcbX